MTRAGSASRHPAGLRAAFAFAAACAAISLPGLGRASLWWDECNTLVMARAIRHLSPTELVAFFGRGLSPYFLLLAPWAEGSPPEWLVRLPSVLAAAGLAAVAWMIGRDRDVPGLAWRCGAAVAVSPFLAWHAREARWYSLAWLLGALSLRHTLCAVGRGGWRDTMLAAAWGLLAAVVYSPAAVPLVVSLAAIAMVHAVRGVPSPPPGGEGPRPVAAPEVRPHRRTTWIGRMSGLAAVVLALVGIVWTWQALFRPLISEGADGFQFTNLGEFSASAVAYTPVAFATGYTIGPGPAEWHHRPRPWPSPVESATLCIGVTCLALLVGLGVRRLRERGAGRESAMLAALIVIPALAVVIAAAWTGHRFAPRHAGMSFLPTILLAAAGTLAPVSSRRPHVVPAAAGLLLLSLQAVSLVNLHLSPRYLREQVGSAARHVAGVATGNDLVLVFGGIDLPWEHYDPGLAPARIVYPDDKVTWTPGTLGDMVRTHDRVIVVRGLIMEVPGEKPLLESLAALTRLQSTATFPGVEVEVRSVPPAETTR